jgi:Flp pilus assembly protein TadD
VGPYPALIAIAALLAQSALERAQLLLREQKVEAARMAVMEALAEKPNSVPALMLRGRIAMAENDFDTARTALTKASALAKDSGPAQFMLGFFHYVDNDFVQARPVLERARKLSPRDSQAALFLALTYEGLALPEQANSTFLETIKLKDSPGARIAYARMLYSQGRFDEAQVHVTRALVLDGNSREAHYEQGRLHFVNHKFEACIAAASRALELAGDGTTERSIHFLLSQAWSRAGNTERAEFHRRQFEAIPPRMVR